MLKTNDFWKINLFDEDGNPILYPPKRYIRDLPEHPQFDDWQSAIMQMTKGKQSPEVTKQLERLVNCLENPDECKELSLSEGKIYRQTIDTIWNEELPTIDNLKSLTDGTNEIYEWLPFFDMDSESQILDMIDEAIQYGYARYISENDDSLERIEESIHDSLLMMDSAPTIFQRVELEKKLNEYLNIPLENIYVEYQFTLPSFNSITAEALMESKADYLYFKSVSEALDNIGIQSNLNELL